MTSSEGWHYVLGSRSPRRLELLRQIVPADAIEVVPPRSSNEAGFDGLSDLAGIEGRLAEIVRAKCANVLDQLKTRPADSRRIVIAADTVVVVRDARDNFRVLGQPPDAPTWPSVVRGWFREYYAGKTHTVATVFCVARPDHPPVYRAVQSAVTFHDDVSRWLEWYLATDEPRGKAGGYAIQGAGSVFISRVEGSLSNVIGLPLRELLEVLAAVSGEASRAQREKPKHVEDSDHSDLFD
jgi:septum formation protein